MKTFKILGIAGSLVAAALVGGTLINAVSAAPSGTAPASQPAAKAADAATYCAQWQQAFAHQLGVPVSSLVPAAKAATIATIDAAVAAGDLPSDVADRMRAAVDKADGDGCRLLGAGLRLFARHAAKVQLGADLASAAADALDISRADLLAALRNGDSLEKIAEDHGKDYATVSKAVHDAAKANLDALVTAGKLAQAREDSLLAGLDKALAAGRFPPAGWGRFGLHAPAAANSTPSS